MKRSAFTITELLIVIAIIALLAAIVLPSFFAVRGKARETSCASNLRQIGMASCLYSQDFDDRFPFGGDPIDVNFPESWGADREAAVKALKPLSEVLNPYIQSKELWHCPSDIGFELGGASEFTSFDTRPSSFEKYKSSYYYRTAFALDQRPFSGIQAWSGDNKNEERGASGIIYLYDGTGIWHGGTVLNTRRYNSLYVDGHVRTLVRANFQQTMFITFSIPNQSGD